MNEPDDDGDPQPPVAEDKHAEMPIVLMGALMVLVVTAGGVVTRGAKDEWPGRSTSAAGSPSASPSPSPSPSPSDEAAQKSAPPNLIVKTKRSARLPFDLERIAAQVSKVRGLTFEAPVRVTSLKAKAWRKLLRPNRASKRVLNQEETLLESLGLVPEGIDISEIKTKIQPSSTVGLYVPETKRLYLRVASRLPRGFREAVVAHELAHALQDQAFDTAYLRSQAVTLDHFTALSGLVEGDAIRTEGLWSNRFQSKKERRARARIGRESKRAFRAAAGNAAIAALDFYTFPYVDGLLFVRDVIDRRGMEGLNEAFLEVPYTTEAVLHPHIYFSGQGRKKPVVTEPAKGWKQAFRHRFGELEVRQIFANLGRKRATQLAAGWNGAEIRVYKPRGGTGTATAMHLVFDDRAEARQACRLIPTWFSLVALGQEVDDQVMQGATGWMARSCPEKQVDVAVAPDQRTALRLVGGYAKNAVP